MALFKEPGALPDTHHRQTSTNPDQQAVIDIGSNTVRLVIFEGDPRVPTVVWNEKVQARLGKGLANGGKLSAKSMATALTAMRRFALILNARNVCRVHTVATAAVRDASNGSEFLAQVEELGLRPRLLSGEEEALTSALGVSGAFPDARGVVADLGGGSLELVHIAGWTCEHGSSLRLGTLRLPRLRETAQQKFRRETQQMIAAAGSRCQTGEALYLVGGSFRALARYYLHSTQSPLDDPHGFEMGADKARALCRSLQRTAPAGPVPGVSTSRLNTLQDTAALLEPLIIATRAERLVFSGWGLREGVVLQSLPESDRLRDPFARSALAFVGMQGVSEILPAQTARWISTAKILPADKDERAIAAIALGLALRNFDPNLRSATALNWALHKRWIGLSVAGRGMLAACLLTSVNRPVPEEVRKLVKPEEIHAAIAVGIAMRLCWRLCGFAPSLLGNIALHQDVGRLVLSVYDSAKDLLNENVAKDFAELSRHLRTTAVTQLAPTH